MIPARCAASSRNHLPRMMRADVGIRPYGKCERTALVGDDAHIVPKIIPSSAAAKKRAGAQREDEKRYYRLQEECSYAAASEVHKSGPKNLGYYY